MFYLDHFRAIKFRWEEHVFNLTLPRNTFDQLGILIVHLSLNAFISPVSTFGNVEDDFPTWKDLNFSGLFLRSFQPAFKWLSFLAFVFPEIHFSSVRLAKCKQSHQYIALKIYFPLFHLKLLAEYLYVSWLQVIAHDSYTKYFITANTYHYLSSLWYQFPCCSSPTKQIHIC